MKITSSLFAGAALAIIAAAVSLVQITSPALAASGTMTPVPSASGVVAGEVLTVAVRQNADVPISAAQVTFQFDQTKFQVTDVALGPDWGAATFIIGVGAQTEAQAIADANSSGALRNIAGYFSPGSGSVPAGTRTFVTVTLQSLASSGSPSAIELVQPLMNDTLGNSIPVTGSNSSIVFATSAVGGVVETITGGTSGSSTLPFLTVIGLAAAAIAAGVVGLRARQLARNN